MVKRKRAKDDNTLIGGTLQLKTIDENTQATIIETMNTSKFGQTGTITRVDNMSQLTGGNIGTSLFVITDTRGTTIGAVAVEAETNINTIKEVYKKSLQLQKNVLYYIYDDVVSGKMFSGSAEKKLGNGFSLKQKEFQKDYLLHQDILTGFLYLMGNKDSLLFSPYNKTFKKNIIDFDRKYNKTQLDNGLERLNIIISTNVYQKIENRTLELIKNAFDYLIGMGCDKKKLSNENLSPVLNFIKKVKEGTQEFLYYLQENPYFSNYYNFDFYTDSNEKIQDLFKPNRKIGITGIQNVNMMQSINNIIDSYGNQKLGKNIMTGFNEITLETEGENFHINIFNKKYETNSHLEILCKWLIGEENLEKTEETLIKKKSSNNKSKGKGKSGKTEEKTDEESDEESEQKTEEGTDTSDKYVEENTKIKTLPNPDIGSGDKPKPDKGEKSKPKPDDKIPHVEDVIKDNIFRYFKKYSEKNQKNFFEKKEEINNIIIKYSIDPKKKEKEEARYQYLFRLIDALNRPFILSKNKKDKTYEKKNIIEPVIFPTKEAILDVKDEKQKNEAYENLKKGLEKHYIPKEIFNDTERKDIKDIVKTAHTGALKLFIESVSGIRQNN